MFSPGLLPLSDSQKANPVYQTMLDIMDGNYKLWSEYEKAQYKNPLRTAAIMMLNASYGQSNKYGVFTSYRSPKNNDDVFHQVIDVLFANKTSNIDLCDPDAMRGCNPDAIRFTFNLAADMCPDNKLFTVDNVFSLLGMMIPIPYETCNYARISPKAMEYLLSLGSPKKNVVESFLEDCKERCRMYECDNLEEIITFVLNGKTNAIYYGCRNGVFYGFRYIKGDGNGDFTWMETASYTPSDNTYYEDRGYEDEENVFDIRALVVNLWAARTTRAFSSSSEPNENRKYMSALCGTVKPNFNLYKYVHITPEGEAQYNESKRIISGIKADAEYRKTIWFTRAYYARRGADKVITYCKASIHHRKCAPVTEGTTVTIYT